MTLRLYLIRHGQSQNNAKPDIEHYEFDPQLTDIGHRQANAVADYLSHATDSDTGELGSGYGITHLYTSPMRRTLQTTRPIAQALKLNPAIWVATHERGGIVVVQKSGVYHQGGMTRQQIATEYPNYDIPHQVTDEGWWKEKSGLESHDMVALRAHYVAEELRLKASYHHHARMALVTHGTFMHHLVRALLNDREQVFVHHNTGISRLDIDAQGKATLIYLDRALHLHANILS